MNFRFQPVVIRNRIEKKNLKITCDTFTRTEHAPRESSIENDQQKSAFAVGKLNQKDLRPQFPAKWQEP